MVGFEMSKDCDFFVVLIIQKTNYDSNKKHC